MARYLHTMVRITDPERSRAFYEALGFRFSSEMDIVRNGQLEATNYFFSIGDHEDVLELTYNHDVVSDGRDLPGDERRLQDRDACRRLLSAAEPHVASAA